MELRKLVKWKFDLLKAFLLTFNISHLTFVNIYMLSNGKKTFEHAQRVMDSHLI